MGKIETISRKPFREGGLATLEICQLRSGRRAIVRKLQDQYRFNRQIRSRFVKGLESRAAVGRHEHVVWSYEHGREGFLPYELLDYVDGLDLLELKQRDADLINRRGLEILLHVAEALQHCHDHNVVHLDIKPSNVIVSLEDDRPMARLTDFDLAIPLDGSVGGKKMRMGTYNYMPAEMLRDGEVSKHADVFAFGVMAYSLFADRMPFAGETAAESRANKENPHYEVARLSSLSSRVSKEFSDLVHRCLDRRRDYRGTMKSLIKDLCRVIALEALNTVRIDP